MFPGATHTRFEHCIGTGHLASKMIGFIKKNCGGELDITEQDITDVTIAGLLHDIGHAVNSHGFEHNVIRKLSPTCEWNHEIASGMLLEHMVDEYGLDLEHEDVRAIKAMICGEKPSVTSDKRISFLFGELARLPIRDRVQRGQLGRCGQVRLLVQGLI